ncbi:MAG TPA: hypothetical protein VGW10_18565, partial [Solirubrobacteraceae bacterium]|nr:hypothetical protein [Solirubrobacteraceae bacterium]
MVLRVLSLALLFAALSGSAAAHELESHGDPRAALPDSLVTEPVARAEIAGTEAITPQAATGLPETWCGSETTVDGTVNERFAPSTPQLKLIYAYAADQPNRFAEFKDRLQASVSLINRFVAQQSGGRKTLRWDMGTSCGADYVDVQVVRLPRDRSEYVVDGRPRFVLTAADLEAIVEPAQPGPRNWVVYADAFYGTNGVAGTAWSYEDDSATAQSHDRGRLEAAVFGPQTPQANGYAWPSVMLHEITHNLGAVQQSAPHTTGNGHCNDRYDVMCYPDGGPTAAPTYPCPKMAGTLNETFDCGGDDYFNPAPAFDSYLDRKWNVYRSAHLATCTAGFTEACDGTAVDGTPPADTTPRRNATALSNQPYTVTLSGTDGESAVDAFAWRVDDGPLQTTQTATVEDGDVLSTRVRDAAGNWSAWRADPVRVDAVAPVTTLDCPSETVVDETATCRVRSTEGETFEVTLDGEPATTVPAAGGEHTITIAKVGETAVSARSRDAAGNVSEAATATVRLQPSVPTVVVSCPDGWHTAIACDVAVTPGAHPVAAVTWRLGSGTPAVLSGTSFSVTTHGQHTATVTAIDAAGRSGTGSDAAWLDAVDPAVALDCPSGWTADSATCTVTASDGASGLDGLTWTVDGGDARTGPSGSQVTVGHGAHTVTATARDVAGRTRTVDAVARADATPPDASLSCPDGWQTEPAACTVTASDPESGVAARLLRVDAGTPFDALTATAVATEGEHQVAGRAVNGAGTASDWTASAPLLIDLFAPVATLDCGPIVDGAYDCVAGGADTGAGIAAVDLVHDGEVRDPIALGERFSFPAQGETLAVRVTDAAGRETTSAPVSVRPAQATQSGSTPPPGPGTATEDPPPAPPPPPGPVTPPVDPPKQIQVLPPPPLVQRPSPLIDRRGRRVASFVLTPSGPGAADLLVTPKRLGAGTWRVKACAGSRCTTRSLRLRRAGTPKPLRTTLAA